MDKMNRRNLDHRSFRKEVPTEGNILPTWLRNMPTFKVGSLRETQGKWHFAQNLGVHS